MRIIDISRDVMQAEVYPGDPLPELTRLESMSDECCYNLSSISMCCHTGTHVDAPLHFIDDGAGIESCPPDAFIGECHVVAVRPGIITGEDAETLLPFRSAARATKRSPTERFCARESAFSKTLIYRKSVPADTFCLPLPSKSKARRRLPRGRCL